MLILKKCQYFYEWYLFSMKNHYYNILFQFFIWNLTNYIIYKYIYYYIATINSYFLNFKFKQLRCSIYYTNLFQYVSFSLLNKILTIWKRTAFVCTIFDQFWFMVYRHLSLCWIIVPVLLLNPLKMQFNENSYIPIYEPLQKSI